MSYLFFKDINREEFDEFVKKMNIVIYYKVITGQKEKITGIIFIQGCIKIMN